MATFGRKLVGTYFGRRAVLARITRLWHSLRSSGWLFWKGCDCLCTPSAPMAFTQHFGASGVRPFFQAFPGNFGQCQCQLRGGRGSRQCQVQRCQVWSSSGPPKLDWILAHTRPSPSGEAVCQSRRPKKWPEISGRNNAGGNRSRCRMCIPRSQWQSSWNTGRLSLGECRSQRKIMVRRSILRWPPGKERKSEKAADCGSEEC